MGEREIGRVAEDIGQDLEAEPVEVKFADPVAGVREEELADRRGVIAVEIDRLTPFARVLAAEIRRRELGEEITLGSQMMADDVEHDHQS